MWKGGELKEIRLCYLTESSSPPIYNDDLLNSIVIGNNTKIIKVKTAAVSAQLHYKVIC